MKLSGHGIQALVSKGFNLPVIRKSRLQWIDYLRGIAIILIVYRHVLVGIQRGNIVMPQILVDANMVFYSFRMPLFFILSGIFISRSLAKKSFNQLVGIKFENLFYPYLVWCTLQITLQILFSGVTNSERSVLDFTYIFYQPRYLDQFWYLPALFNTTIIYLLLKSKLKANSGVQLSLGLIFYFAAPYFQSISMISDCMAFYFFFALGDFLSVVFFKESTQAFFRNYISLLLIIPIFIIAQRYYLQHDLGNISITNKTYLSKPDYFNHVKDQVDFLFIAMVGCLAMFILSFHLQKLKLFSFLRVLGYHSLHIYVMHVIITACTRLSLIIVFHITNPVVLLVTSMALGIILPILIYNFLIKNGPLYFLFHLRKQKAEKPKTEELRPPVVTTMQSVELKS